MNSAVGSIFNLEVAFFHTYGSREQCTEPTEKTSDTNFFPFQCNPINSTLITHFPNQICMENVVER